jgi:uncharacterized protein
VHPEAYPVVARIVARTGLAVGDLIGKSAVLKTLVPEDFSDTQFGVPTVKDILAELDKPSRDPRPEFKRATFKDGVQELRHLVVGMQLEGVVTNVTNFGAFVDIGVHQDGLVHVSQLADRFVKDPREVVKAGDVVTVRVVDVDAARKRIALTMKSGEVRRPATAGEAKPSVQSGAPASGPRAVTAPRPVPPPRPAVPGRSAPPPRPAPAPSTALAAAFAKLQGKG